MNLRCQRCRANLLSPLILALPVFISVSALSSLCLLSPIHHIFNYSSNQSNLSSLFCRVGRQKDNQERNGGGEEVNRKRGMEGSRERSAEMKNTKKDRNEEKEEAED